MPHQMLTESDWDRNVGTQAFPVSFLHEYAVRLLWDSLHSKNRVTVKTIDGNMSDNLMDGVDRVIIPDSMQPIGGCIPDLALLDKDLRPVRIIEVIVNSPPTGDKMDKLERLKQRGVEVVLIPVRSEEELKALVPPPFEGQQPNWAYEWTPTVFEQMGIINIPRQRQIRTGQLGADSKIEELIHALIQCQPETRRKLVKVMQEMDSLESRYPLSPKNPKRMITTANGSDS